MMEKERFDGRQLALNRLKFSEQQHDKEDKELTTFVKVIKTSKEVPDHKNRSSLIFLDLALLIKISAKKEPIHH